MPPASEHVLPDPGLSVTPPVPTAVECQPGYAEPSDAGDAEPSLGVSCNPSVLGLNAFETVI